MSKEIDWIVRTANKLSCFGISDDVDGRADANMRVEPEILPPASSGQSGRSRRSKLGNRLVLGHSVWRRDGRWVVGPSDDALTAKPDAHVMTLAPTGSSKATGIGVPNLLNWSGCAVVLDPKGELAWMTAEYRKRHLGHEIYIIDPWRVVETMYWEQWAARGRRFTRDETVVSAKCNPLAGLDPDSSDFDRVARDIAVGLCPVTPGEKPFFDRSAQALLYRLMLAVASGYSVQSDARGSARRPVSLRTMRGELQQGKDAIRAMIDRAEHSSDERTASLMRRFTRGTDSVEDAYQTAETATEFLVDRTLTGFVEPLPGERELDLSMLRDPERKFTIYIVLPQDMFQSMSGWLRVMLQRTIREAQRALRKDKILFLLDELGSIGRVENLAEAYAIGRGAGICCWGLWQDLSQLKADYGDRFSTFEGNSAVVQFYRTFDRETAEYIAQKIGREERMRKSTTHSTQSSTQGGQGSSSSSWSTTSSWSYEQAMDAAEVEQTAQRVMGNFRRAQGGKLFFSVPMEYYLTPFFNGLYRPVPNKPERGLPPYRPACSVDEFLRYREGWVA